MRRLTPSRTGSARKPSRRARIVAESVLHATEKTVAEHGAKLADTDRRAIENAMADPFARR